jgi:hypothetical protein
MELIILISLLIAVGVFGFFIVLVIYAVKELKRVKEVEYGVLVDDGLKYKLVLCSVDHEDDQHYILRCNDKSVSVSKNNGRFITRRSPPFFLKHLVKVWIVDTNYVEKTSNSKTLDHKQILELRKLDTTSNYLLRKYQSRYLVFTVLVIIILVIVFMVYNYFENMQLMHPQHIIIRQAVNQTTTHTVTKTIHPPIPTTPPPR